MKDDASGSEISWPESEQEEVVLPITPRTERTHDVLGKRKLESGSSEGEASHGPPRDEPQTPVNHKRIKQLETPPDTDRQRGSKGARGTVTDSPSKTAATRRTFELVSELEANEALGSLGTRLRLHIHKQDRLLDASNKSRDVLRKLLKSRDLAVAALQEKVKVYENERETHRAVALALKREIHHLETQTKGAR
ncbi:protein of unknown function [Taphrina deformans PYCC 5710]|uniref:Uncharacterized protein n=1 Tax=Taphrina deformans (strain PYCC 5710 / ATCC 11124 / CBS 356.35 / IMI 108563 / JCM 9778 / NBRC 8474) TaxID=1097556 RepID=R4X868_TAPDE|nr:protein of unknown function [Taphrina deformans PYCC 5710]|eukprot:CCG81693.1 protein of unknown function [Taphrina deformans PYCC 5710]